MQPLITELVLFVHLLRIVNFWSRHCITLNAENEKWKVTMEY